MKKLKVMQLGCQKNKENNLTSDAPLVQLVKCLTLDRKVAGANLTRGAVLCP